MPGQYKKTLYACYLGFITQAINNNLTPLFFVVFHDKFGMSFEMLGRLVVLNFGTQILADIVSVKYVDRIGYRAAAVIAHVLSFLGLVCLGVLPLLMTNTLAALTIAVVISAWGGGIIEVIVSPITESLPTPEKSAAMSLLHSFYCWGQMAVVIITTLCVWLFGTEIWYLLPILWSVIPLYNTIKFMRVPLYALVPAGEELRIVELFRSPFFGIALLLMIAAGASEHTMTQWSSIFAEVGLGIPKLVGDLVGPALFAFFMGVGRTIYGLWGEKIDLYKVLQGGGLLCVMCYATAVFANVPLLALLGAALCGLSVSLMWPGTYSLTSARFPRGGTAMFGILAIFGDLGASVGPWLAGFVSDLSQQSALVQDLGLARGLGLEQVGLRVGLLVGILFPVLMLLGVRGMARKVSSGGSSRSKNIHN
ncbi:MAG: MFS transporter [Limnochordia bacterium]|nr:MFS transporter [Limnochordia bacterium]